MTAPDIDPTIVERAIDAAYGCGSTSPEDIARAVLSAVAEGRMQTIEGLRGTQKALLDEARVEGARQVLTAVEAEKQRVRERFGIVAPGWLIAAAREAVERIEKGGE